jgi:NhaP-type Na+/H+ or K+/H+ antiporter
VFLARPVAFLPALLPVRTPWRSRALIAWFGPRGLSSLLLVLLAVFADVRGGTELVAICALVVLFSIVVHGFSPLLLPKSSPAVTASVSGDREYITIDEYRAAAAAGGAITVVDARAERTLDDEAPANSVRMPPDEAVATANAFGLPRENRLAVLCA